MKEAYVEIRIYNGYDIKDRLKAQSFRFTKPNCACAFWSKVILESELDEIRQSDWHQDADGKYKIEVTSVDDSVDLPKAKAKPKEKKPFDWDKISLKDYKAYIKGINWYMVKRDHGAWCSYDFARELAYDRNRSFIDAFEAEAKRNGVPTDL